MPKKGYKQTEKHRKNVSKALKGRVINIAWRKKISNTLKIKYRKKEIKSPSFWKEKHPNLEHRNKISISLKKAYAERKIIHHMEGKHHTQKTRSKISETEKIAYSKDIKVPYWKNKKLSKNHRRKISYTNLKLYKEGNKKIWNKNIPQTEEAKRKNSEAHKGSKSHFWQGGKSFEPYGLEFNKGLKQAIRYRDHYRCQQCFRHENELFTKKGKHRKLVVHHIDYDKRNNNPKNLISLCPNCHSQTNFSRKDWEKYFIKRLKTLNIL